MSLDKKASIPGCLEWEMGPAAHRLADTSDHVHWAIRDPSKNELTRPHTGGLANSCQ